MEIVPSASLDTFPSENENFLCDLTDIAVTKKPCSLEIARAPSPRTGNISFLKLKKFFLELVIFLTYIWTNSICMLVYVKMYH